MKTTRMMLAIWLVLGCAVPSAALAHEGAPGNDAGDVHARSTAEGNVVEASTVVGGKVADLKGALYRVESWPELFTDVRALSRKPDGIWVADFAQFGHAHDFKVARTASGVRFELAAENHGVGRLEYALQPIDATRSRLKVRFVVTTPPQLTSEQMFGILREKAARDLEDFRRYARQLAMDPSRRAP